MPRAILYETVKQQTFGFLFVGCAIKFDIESMEYGASALISIIYENKIYKFSDPDWDVVSKQLTSLYFKIKEQYERETNTNHD